MHWPSADQIAASLAIPSGLRLRVAARQHVPAIATALPTWYPNLAIAEDADLLDPAFYDRAVALDGQDHDVRARPTLALLLEAAQERIVGVTFVDYDVEDDLVVGRMTIVDPQERGASCGRTLVEATIATARVIGARGVLGLVELDNRAQNRSMFRTGHLLSGVIADSDRKAIAGVGMRYVPEAIFVHPLCPPEDLVPPPTSALRPETARLFDLLFGGGHAAGTEPVRIDPPAPLRGGPADAPETWPSLTGILERLPIPRGTTLGWADRAEVLEATARLGGCWDPSGAIAKVRSSALEDSIGAAGAAIALRPALVWVLRDATGPVAFGGIVVELARSTIRVRLGGYVADWREAWLRLAAEVPRRVTEALGLEAVHGRAPLGDPLPQLAYETSGYQLIGVLPHRARGGGDEEPSFEALYARSYVARDQIHSPDRSAMDSRVADLIGFVEGGLR